MSFFIKDPTRLLLVEQNQDKYTYVTNPDIKAVSAPLTGSSTVKTINGTAIPASSLPGGSSYGMVWMDMSSDTWRWDMPCPGMPKLSAFVSLERARFTTHRADHTATSRLKIPA